jgi:hypothetical protein
MSATTSAAVKAWLETQSLGVPVYRDEAPSEAGYPRVVVHDGISRRPAFADNAQWADADHPIVELVQVDIWQRKRGDDDAKLEDPTLEPRVFRALHGCRLATAPTHVFGVQVQSSVRLLEGEQPSQQIVHDALTVRVDRNL